ncbi:MAG: DUF354 domain-containing protein [Trueperaceae bacterium]|nr:MAG: DUF354 domain-containing protein [Trueperaceae bacterium]
MPTVTILSNGHGEDVIGAQLAQELLYQRPDLLLQAYPTVDRGEAYESVGIPILGPRKRMPSGGLLLHSMEYFVEDIRAGFVPMTLRQIRDLWQLQTDVLLVVGDIYAQLLSALVRAEARFVVQSLVSAYQSHGIHLRRLNRSVMENITYFERVLMRRLAVRVYVRDERTRASLEKRGLDHVRALGNPILDALQGEPITELKDEPCVVALLPGTRRHAEKALDLMLEALARLSGVTGVVAWAAGDLPDFSNWQVKRGAAENLIAILQRASQRVFVFRERFADVLKSSDLVLGTAGTANEQAVALGIPVISFALPPFYTAAFLENQKRLLGDSLVVTSPDIREIAAVIDDLRNDAEYMEQVARLGPERLGRPGGSRAIVNDLLECAGKLGVIDKSYIGR